MRILPVKILALVGILMFSAALATFADECKPSKEDQKKYSLALDKAVTHFDKFKVLLEDDKTKEALKELQIIIGIDFSMGCKGSDGALLQIEAFIYNGEMLTDAGDLEGAVKTLKSGIAQAADNGIEIDSRSYDLYMALGHAYKKLKKNDEALAAFEKADEINKALQEKEEKQKSN
jgi:tetratricopeptide (TPR) repeat protein